MANFWALIQVLKGFLNIFSLIRQAIAKREVEKELERKSELDKGLDDLKTAKTDEEIFDAEEKVSTNHP